MICARTVFKSFKTLERWGNKITGAAGPYFVAFAVLLIGSGTICFFDVIAPSLSYPFISIPICLLIALNLHAHYFYVCTVKPGFLDDPPLDSSRTNGWMWAKKRDSKSSRALTGGVRWTTTRVTPAALTRCNKCSKMRPERAHHCKICNRCILKYDHHCPWINQCVGIHNERHFVMFLIYLIVSTVCFAALGYEQFFMSLGMYTRVEWSYHVPELMFGMIYILVAVLGLAVSVMLAYHLWLISNGETSVEAQDHDQYRRRAKARKDEFINSYDVGRWKNLQLFFNIGENGYPLYTLIFPFRIMPYTDGRSWARREGYDRHHGVRAGEEITDESGDEELDYDA